MLEDYHGAVERRDAIRPPRRPARFRPLAALRPILLIVVAVGAALVLMEATTRFVVHTASALEPTSSGAELGCLRQP